MSSKTTTNNTTRKDWKAKVDATLTSFKINGQFILDKNNKGRVRIEQLKPGVTKFLPENKPGDVRRQFPKGKDIWKPTDVIKFKYLFNKYGKKHSPIAHCKHSEPAGEVDDQIVWPNSVTWR